ncbi:MAG: helix-turn-helix domain-containing protein [Actinobacteria bacterium]|nr:helix-turn-helix domain-containing protein [Actinomycetota bacterium]
MARKSAHQIVLEAEERAELERRAACYTLPHKQVQRAKFVLYAADGLTNVEIAARLDTAPEVVARWRRRFYEERLDGLDDRARCGAPRRFPPAAGRRGEGGRVRTSGAGRATLAPLVR